MVDSFDAGSGCAARSMIVAAGRWECGNLLVLEISSISTAAFGLGAILIAQALHLQGVAVEARQRKGSEVHAIVTIIDRQQRDAFSIQHLAEKHIPLLPVNHPSLPHAAHHAGAAIVRCRYPCGILSRRRAVARLRGLHVQRLMRTLLVIFLPEPVQGSLLSASIGLGRRCSFLLQGAMHTPTPPGAIDRRSSARRTAAH